MTRAPPPTSPVALHTAFRQLQASDSYSSQQVFERNALRRMLLGVGLLQPLQVDQFPANRRKLGSLGQTDQSEIRLGAVEGKQEGSDPACQSRPYGRTQTPTRPDERRPGRGHPCQALAFVVVPVYPFLPELCRYRYKLFFIKYLRLTTLPGSPHYIPLAKRESIGPRKLSADRASWSSE